jgi:hypothetical protein
MKLEVKDIIGCILPILNPLVITQNKMIENGYEEGRIYRRKDSIFIA